MATTGKRKKPSDAHLRRPFAAGVMKRAREIAETYQIVIRSEYGEYYGEGLELPGAMGTGKTPDECIKSTWKALAVSVACMIEDGLTPPVPARDEVRTEQVNIRLTAREEKRILENAAGQQGFRGISDYVRATALQGSKA